MRAVRDAAGTVSFVFRFVEFQPSLRGFERGVSDLLGRNQVIGGGFIFQSADRIYILCSPLSQFGMIWMDRM